MLCNPGRASLGLTMGDPNGIGPEVLLKAIRALQREPPSSPWASIDAVAYGDPVVLAEQVRRFELGRNLAEVLGPVRLCATARTDAFTPGRATAVGGLAAWNALTSAITDLKRGLLGAIVTAPVSKHALAMAGHGYPGQTEILAEAADGVPVRMMLKNSELATVLVTAHLPLKQVIEHITVAGLEETIRISDLHVRRYEGRPARIAVAGLNPHAGECGLLGREEIEIIRPAVARARADGINAEGPFPPDTIFMHARRTRQYDLVIAQYHDQGLIPIKYLGVENGVNITIGLPFIRTSPDHGTAFDISGRGIADPSSMAAAIRQAVAYLSRRSDGRSAGA